MNFIDYIHSLWTRAKAAALERLRLIDDWRRVLVKSYTTWFSAAAVMLGGIEIWHADLVAALPLIDPFLPPALAGKLSVTIMAAVPVVRLFKQFKQAVEDARRGADEVKP